MSAAISGLRNHQVYMDVVANNIANVNTTGFKSGRVNFKDAIAQTSSTGSAATSSTGGMNPIQVGLGMNVGGVDTMLTQGSLISTGKNTDLAIQGEGLFMLGKGDPTVAAGLTAAFFTRDGGFSLDKDGFLVDRTSGYYVLDSLGTSAIRVGKSLDGLTSWNWATFSIGPDGKLTGVLADGSTDAVNHPQLGLAKFANPEGLLKGGGNTYQEGANSGTAVPAAPGNLAAGLGLLVPGSLEASNVDLAEQFSRMIMAQRGFQANSRAITASDEMLQDLVNIKR